MDFDAAALRLNELTYEFFDACRIGIETKNFEKADELIVEHNKIILSIRKYFLDNPVALIPSDVSNTTRTLIQDVLITGTSPLQKSMVGTPLASIFNYLPDHIEMENLVSKYYSSWFSDYDYIEAILETAALVLRADKLPDELITFLNELRQCFAFQQYLATIVLCRTSLELGLFHLCNIEKINGIYAEMHESNPAYIEDFVPAFHDMRNKLTSLSDYNHFNIPLRDLYHDLSRYIHGQHNAGRPKAESLMTRTFKLLHDLYEA